MKRKKGKKGVVMRLTEYNGDYFLGGVFVCRAGWHRRKFPKLKPGESCKVRVTIERVK